MIYLLLGVVIVISALIYFIQRQHKTDIAKYKTASGATANKDGIKLTLTIRKR